MTETSPRRFPSLAALLLFTTEPTDRALDGWYAGELWCAEELADLGVRR